MRRLPQIILLAILINSCNQNQQGSSNDTTKDSAISRVPQPDPAFKGTIAPTTEGAKADFPSAVQAPKGAPNVLIILLDDVGFGQTSTFGGPVPTPTLERLAKNGLKYNRFFTTALCS